VALTTALGRLVDANPTTIGFAFLVVVLLAALRLGLAASTLASLAATAAYNYFFLPPVGAWTISDPANWVALATFLLASFVVSRLATREKRRAEEAESRRKEMEALYDLSVDLFAATNRVGALGEAAGRALRAMGASGGGLVLLHDGESEVVTSLGKGLDPADPLLPEVVRAAQPAELPAEGGTRDVYLPLAVGGKASGVLVIRGTRAQQNALASAGRLVALAIERDKFLSERVHLDALRESDALKTSLLRAVSHDLRTPITSIRLGLDRLRRSPLAAGVVEDVARETERLSRRIDNLLSMARLDAGTFIPRPEPAPAADLFRAALEALPLALEGRTVDVSVARETPDLLVDPALAVEILVNLLENASRSGSPGAPLALAAEPSPRDAARVRLDVLDRGSGISPELKQAASGGAPGDASRGGLGLAICQSLARAMGGTIALVDRPGGGTIARLEVPAAVTSGEIAT
jgi:two-component system, OmpR family, sensor histidine kinase KdpD